MSEIDDESLPCGFYPVTVLRSPTSVHRAAPVFVVSTFAPAPLRLVGREPKPAGWQNRLARILAPPPTPPTTPIRRVCVNPPDPVTARAEWLKRLADYREKLERRRQRVDWYLCQRAARS
jgi:hypothetical protein